MIFYFIFILVIIQRLIELVIAKRNEKRMLAKGAYEVGAAHYPYMILLHVGFFISFLMEVLYFKLNLTVHYEWLALFLLLQPLRVWCVSSLGIYWNTKIIILPGAQMVVKGPYAFLRHPNYVVVCLEIAVLPLMFSAYITASLFTILNILMLVIRIPLEEKALNEVSNNTMLKKGN